jgi:CheY-like chemotaxis protein
MSELMTVPPPAAPEKKTPTVYFIDDSATMREVIKIAFRRENIQVVTCADAASALAQFEQTRPDVVITDVIMPDQDGYSVCSRIKEDPELGKTPVVLMSGVVNKSVADKAVAVKADELIRKPFQPQELIARVKSLLGPKEEQSTPARHLPAAGALSGLFAPQPAQPGPRGPVSLPMAPGQPAESVWPRGLAEAFTHQPAASAPTAQPSPLAANHAQPYAVPPDVKKLRAEIAHLDLLVKKLQTELQIERQYNQALETQIRLLTESA